MSRALRQGLGVVGILAGCLPVSFVATIVLFPLWGWVERHLAVVSVGHSGPAEWCYLATYLACIAACGAAAILWRSSPPPRPSP
jgi:hypothetical protein